MPGQQLTEADLENMSPEQIAELQKQNCIFCHIIEGKILAKKVYEDDKCIAILDINPASKGHMLLMPKEHHVVLQMAPEETIKHLGKIIKLLSKTAIRALGAEGTNILVGSGAIAGQKAPHAIIHVIPRNENDHITCFDLPEKTIPESDLKKMQGLFSRVLGTVKNETPVQVKPVTQNTLPKTNASDKKYITSEKATRYHVANCPFVEKIPEDSRIYLDEKTAKTRRKPCPCTKPAEKISLKDIEEMTK